LVLAVAALVAMMMAGSAASALAQPVGELLPEESCDELEETVFSSDVGPFFETGSGDCAVALPGHPTQFDPPFGPEENA
jgi:hypothetical protein